MTRQFENPDVKAVFDGLPGSMRDTAMTLRDLIFDVAQDSPQVGRVALGAAVLSDAGH